MDVGRDVDYVFARVEQMMPVLPLLRARDFKEAVEWAVLLERNLRHTAGLYSRNIENMDAMARRMNTSLFVKNGPHVAGLGRGRRGMDLHDHLHPHRRGRHQRPELRAPSALHPGGQLQDRVSHAPQLGRGATPGWKRPRAS